MKATIKTTKLDFHDVKGQEHVKRGLEVAVAGSHSVLLIGPPGSGKTMLAKRLRTITDTDITLLENIPEMRREFLDRELDAPGRVIAATMNPCPCGYFTDPEKDCNCTPYQIQRYLSKIRGRFLERIDIQIEVPRLKYHDLSKRRSGEYSKDIKERVDEAKAIQKKRDHLPGYCNSDLVPEDIEKYCLLTQDSELILKTAIMELGLSARAYDKILRVSRTIADLENTEQIEAHHISEAISYRTLDRTYGIA